MLSFLSLLLLVPMQTIASNAYVCPALVKPAYGNSPKVVLDSSVAAVYSCIYGYRLVGDRVRYCVKQEYSDYYYWTGSMPTCVRDCPAPASPSKGRVVVKGGNAMYFCDRGYVLDGSSLRACKDGSWTDGAPKCVKDSKCLALSSPLYGEVIITDSGQLATYTCNKGYSIVGDTLRKCSNGRWTGSVPSCCQTLSAPSNGGLSVEDGRVTYFCNDGYQLVGDSLRLCKNSTWNGTLPICVKEQCLALSHPANGRVRLNQSGKRAWYTCSWGYTLIGEALRKCVYGIWLGSSPVCDKICPRLGSPVNGYVHYQDQSTVTYTCYEGFNLQGNRRRTCSRGVWGGRQPSCVPTCPRLASPEDGSVRVFGDTARYSCNSGFSLRGTSRRTCSGGVWSGIKPSCKRGETR
jgi:CUB/sushi domain-containing protein